MRAEWVCAAAFAAAMGLGSASATTIEYTGPADPTTEGFGVIACCGSGPGGTPLADDLGFPAWSIGGGTLGWQYGYASGTLSAAEKAVMDAEGFMVTSVSRVILGAGAVYSTSDPNILGGVDVDTGLARWEMDFGVDAAGDTVVVLPNTIDAGGPGGAVRGWGVSFAVGSGYNTYQLVVAPGEVTASLWVDGIELATGYTGETSYVVDRGLVFGGWSGGTANYNLVSLSFGASAIPEPSTWAMLLAGFASLGIVGLRRRPKSEFA